MTRLDTTCKVLVVLALLSPASALAQIQVVNGSAGMDTLASKYRVDFAIPDAPAFVLVKVEDSKILRPVSVRDFALGFSNFQDDDGDFDVPDAFGVEVAPFLLA